MLITDKETLKKYTAEQPDWGIGCRKAAYRPMDDYPSVICSFLANATSL